MLIFILLFLIAYRFSKKQLDCFSWHQKHFLHDSLTPTEETYVRHCLRFSFLELLRCFLPPSFLHRLSFVSYSHVFQKGKLSSRRMACGALLFPTLAYDFALDVFLERSIFPPWKPTGNYCFGGLGWDFDKQLFKIYYRYYDFGQLPPEYQRIVTKEKEYLKEGIVSWTYKKRQLIEKKIYRYTEKETHLFSDVRGMILQLDCQPGEEISWSTKSVEKLKNFYKKNNYDLDTYALTKNKLVLYFPMIT